MTFTKNGGIVLYSKLRKVKKKMSNPKQESLRKEIALHLNRSESHRQSAALCRKPANKRNCLRWANRHLELARELRKELQAEKEKARGEQFMSGLRKMLS